MTKSKLLCEKDTYTLLAYLSIDRHSQGVGIKKTIVEISKNVAEIMEYTEFAKKQQGRQVFPMAWEEAAEIAGEALFFACMARADRWSNLAGMSASTCGSTSFPMPHAMTKPAGKFFPQAQRYRPTAAAGIALVKQVMVQMMRGLTATPHIEIIAMHTEFFKKLGRVDENGNILP